MLLPVAVARLRRKTESGVLVRRPAQRHRLEHEIALCVVAASFCVAIRYRHTPADTPTDTPTDTPAAP